MANKKEPSNRNSRTRQEKSRTVTSSSERLKKLSLYFIFPSLVALLVYLYGHGLVSLVPIRIAKYVKFGAQLVDNSDDLLNRDARESARPFEGTTFPMGHHIGDRPIWGTLSSGQYFGQRLSSPLSLETGMMWFDNKLNEHYRLNIRHLCNQDDRLKSYSWRRHDFYNFGEQIIEDDDFELETIFLKDPQNPLKWSAKVKLTSENMTRGPISLIYYITKERMDDRIDLASSRSSIEEEDERGNVNLAEIRGHSKETGKFIMSIDMTENHDKFVYGNFLRLNFDKLQYPLADISHAHLMKTKHDGDILYIMVGNKEVPGLQDTPVEDPNFVAYQIILKPSASFTVTFSPQGQVETREIESSDLDSLHQTHKSAFDSRFSEVFLNNTNYLDREKFVEMSKVSLSNMIGSIGYFYGKSYVMNEKNPEKIVAYGPIQLLTAVPSRSFFPRGFLWDEGFHNMLISKWDPLLSISILKSWFNIMNVDGWMPREVILGIESLRRVPKEFIVQKTSNANPPTMFLPIEHMIDHDVIDVESLNELFPKLRAWFNWFNTTQSGDSYSTFRWRGRDEESNTMLNPKTLSSGLDDYPRATHPSREEYHLDLRCWMALASRTMAKISKKLGDDGNYKVYHDHYEILRNNELMETLHWSDRYQIFCDYGYNSLKMELVRVEKKRAKNGREETYYEMERKVGSKVEFDCVPELGYVSLFPLIMNLLEPDNPKLGLLLEYIRDESKLWSSYGVRSLSKTSPYYNKYNTEHDPPYWRGAIWINLNYLLLKSLEHYSNLHGPHQARSKEIYTELKYNLIRTVHNQYISTSYIWENYNDLTGKGKGSHPFTGWSSLILLILLGRP